MIVKSLLSGYDTRAFSVVEYSYAEYDENNVFVSLTFVKTLHNIDMKGE
jgi:hypothetical protein